MGIVHHAAYLPYLEEARVEYLRSIGHPYDEVRGRGHATTRTAAADFAVLEVSVQYRKPLHFDDEVDVAAWSARSPAPPSRSPTLTVGGEVRATAVTVHGCVDGRGRPARLPAWVREVEGRRPEAPGVTERARGRPDFCCRVRCRAVSGSERMVHLRRDSVTSWTCASRSRSTWTGWRRRRVSPSSTFARAFKEVYGETPANYLTRRRVERAKDLLRSANLTVTEVSVLVGFSSLGSFSSRFTELVGMSPSAFQRRNAARGWATADSGMLPHGLGAAPARGPAPREQPRRSLRRRAAVPWS